MKKLFAIAFMLFIMITANAQKREPMYRVREKTNTSGGYNYSQNRKNNNAYYKKQVYRMRNSGKHSCTGDYSRKRRR